MLNYITRAVCGLCLSCVLLSPAMAADKTAAPPKITKPHPGKMQIIDTELGSGAIAEQGDFAEMHYTGWVYDSKARDHKGLRFDSSYDRNDTFVFKIGDGKVIRGWDEGITGMKTGGERTLIIPSDMAYGSRGAGEIPPDSDLIFEVKLITIPLH